MLNFVYWPISIILWFWHKVISYVISPDSGWSWVLAIVLLTCTIRALLVKPMLNSMRSMAKMQEMQPAMAAIKQKYKGDQQKMLEETRKLQKEYGANPISGCLPMLVQAPVFIGLYHVLRSFNRTGSGPGQLGLTVEQNRELPNYFFSAHDVQSFLDARLFNVPVSAYIAMKPEMYQAFQPVNFTRWNIIALAVPLIIIIFAATHFNGRLSVARTKRRQAQGLSKAPEGMMGNQAEIMNKMMVWVMPFTILLTGAIWHIGLLFYMMSNNVWTYFQQHWMFKMLDREEAEALERKKAARRATAPKPGVKPINPKKGGKRAASQGQSPDVSSQSDATADSATDSSVSSTSSTSTSPSTPAPKGIIGNFKAMWEQTKKEAEAQLQAKSEASATTDEPSPSQASDTDATAGQGAGGRGASNAPKPGAKPQSTNKRKKRNKKNR